MADAAASDSAGDTPLGRVADHLSLLVASLRAAGLTIAPPQHIDFLSGVRQLLDSDIEDLYWIARITLTNQQEDVAIFDAIFAAWCQGSILSVSHEASNPEDDGDEPTSQDQGDDELKALDLGEGSGRSASRDELSASPNFGPTTSRDRVTCARIASSLPTAIPAERTRRMQPCARGTSMDLRRTIRLACRTGGEVLELAQRSQPLRPRKVLILIDISGSLKAHSGDYLRFAHTVVSTLPRSEIYTFGTKLTRVTAALRSDDVDLALARLTDVVFDMDGGTRIGGALEEFLASSERRTMVRGATVLVLSDGLERGAPDAMAAAVKRLARLAHRLVWLSPLASAPNFVPATKAMVAVLDSLDRLGSAASLDEIENEVAHLAVVATAGRGQCSHQNDYCLTPRE